MKDNPTVGNIVGWDATAATIKQSMGRVVQVVPPGRLPDPGIAPDLYMGAQCGVPCVHESYVVRVRKHHTLPFRHVWKQCVSVLPEDLYGEALTRMWEPPQSRKCENPLEEITGCLGSDEPKPAGI